MRKIVINETLIGEVLEALDYFSQDTKVIVLKEAESKSSAFVTEFFLKEDITICHIEDLFYLENNQFIKVTTLYELLEELVEEHELLVNGEI